MQNLIFLLYFGKYLIFLVFNSCARWSFVLPTVQLCVKCQNSEMFFFMLIIWHLTTNTPWIFQFLILLFILLIPAWIDLVWKRHLELGKNCQDVIASVKLGAWTNRLSNINSRNFMLNQLSAKTLVHTLQVAYWARMHNKSILIAIHSQRYVWGSHNVNYII